MNSEQEKIVKGIPMYDLMDACCALQGGMELEKFEDKNYALKHALNRLFGYLTPEAKAEFRMSNFISLCNKKRNCHRYKRFNAR